MDGNTSTANVAALLLKARMNGGAPNNTNSLPGATYRLDVSSGALVVLSMGEPPNLFRLHRQALTENSDIFKDMFDLPPSASAEGASSENPIRLPDDPEHFGGVLHLYYGQFLAPLPDDPDLDFVLGVLRVATKYRFMLARKWAVENLRVDWSLQSPRWLQLFPYPKNVVSDAIKIINASRELQVREFLGSAFWVLWATTPHDENASLYASMHADDILLTVRGAQSAYARWGSMIPSDPTTNPTKTLVSKYRTSILSIYGLLNVEPEKF